MTAPLSRAAYMDLLSLARRHARSGVEAEDLLQEALAVALSSGRELSLVNRAWLGGVMRNLARMNVRSLLRRRVRENQSIALQTPWVRQAGQPPSPGLDGLAPSLCIVALLALGGHNRAEIRHLLRLSDEALRQRISALKRRLSRQEGEMPAEFTALCGELAFGSIRRSLLPLMHAGIADFATHDPDGHPIAIRIRAPHLTKTRSAATG